MVATSSKSSTGTTTVSGFTIEDWNEADSSGRSPASQGRWQSADVSSAGSWRDSLSNRPKRIGKFWLARLRKKTLSFIALQALLFEVNVEVVDMVRQAKLA